MTNINVQVRKCMRISSSKICFLRFISRSDDSGKNEGAKVDESSRPTGVRKNEK